MRNHPYLQTLASLAIFALGFALLSIGVTGLAHYGELTQSVSAYYAGGGEPHTPRISGLVDQMRAVTMISLPLIGIGLFIIVAGVEVTRRQLGFDSAGATSNTVKAA